MIIGFNQLYCLCLLTHVTLFKFTRFLPFLGIYYHLTDFVALNLQRGKLRWIELQEYQDTDKSDTLGLS